MAQITVRLNGSGYSIACDDGQEVHLSHLALLVDERLSELVEQVGQVGDLRLMVMVSLILADELTDLRASMDAEPDKSQPPASESHETWMAEIESSITTIAERIEHAARQLEAL